jgi:hypothetical protein
LKIIICEYAQLGFRGISAAVAMAIAAIIEAEFQVVAINRIPFSRKFGLR